MFGKYRQTDDPLARNQNLHRNSNREIFFFWIGTLSRLIFRLQLFQKCYNTIIEKIQLQKTV